MLNGEDALDEIIDRLAKRAARGEKVAILWDMDGTLVDTRLRMLTAVHAYGRTDVRLAEVSPSWQETADRLGLDRERFRPVWQRVFWAYESFDADTENETVARRARRAESLGIQTIIVTGRIEELRPVTARQLERLGLKPTRVFLKSTLGDCTPSVKAEVISQLAGEGLHLGAFVTDSPEEILAVTPDILAKAPGLVCIFVELEGSSVGPVPQGAAHFMVQKEAHEESPEKILEIEGGPICFGFEAEYEIDAADALLRLYAPEDPTWLEWTPRERAAWVYRQFPDPHSEEFDLPLKLIAPVPSLPFLAPNLFVDSDGNLEIVSPPTDSLEELWTHIESLEEMCGPALWQITFSVPSQAVFGDPQREAAFDGFLTFHQILDTFERMGVGDALARENPEREVLLPFLHPWLGPLTRGKHHFLRMYLEANARGDKLDEKWIRLSDRAFSSFKYISGTAYRPGVAGPGRVAIEIRDAHRNKALLAQRLVRNLACIVGGLEPYAPFAEVWAFDSEADYERLPAAIRETLERVIPSIERPEIDFMYSAYDRIALQVYRHFALPLQDFSALERALGQKLERIEDARNAYLRRLSIANTRSQFQAALAAFAGESGVLEALEAFSKKSLKGEAVRQIQALMPLSHASPRTAWTGSLSRRLARLQSRWPAQVRYNQPSLFISLHGLNAQGRSRLVADYLDAVASHSFSVRATDRGELEMRVGHRIFTPGASASEARVFQPRTGPLEPILELSPLQNLALRSHLAAHEPGEYAAHRVSASGWLRYLRTGTREVLEQTLQLPEPGIIETAAQVVGHLLDSKPAAVVHWTEQPLEGFVSQPLPSTLASGFPTEPREEPPLPERLENFIERWPHNARLVSDVPFSFGKGSQHREVLVLAREGLNEEEAESFRQDYVDTIGCDTISFPLREGAEHLRTRIGALTFALSPEGLRVDDYQAPRPRRRRLEAVLRLEPGEMWNLRRAVGAILDNTLGVLGPITLDAGSRKTTARLDDNRPLDGGEHNCTTWITLAPLGSEGEDLATLAQMPAHWTSHDNPGWWSMFLTGASRSPRAGLVVYWTDKSLEDEPCASGVAIPWDFNPR